MMRFRSIFFLISALMFFVSGSMNVKADSNNTVNLSNPQATKEPKLSLSIDPPNWTNKNVTINVNTNGKKVMYIGENMIRNSGFNEGENGAQHWGRNYGDVIFSKGSVLLKDNSISNNKFHQRDAFTDTTIGSTFYAEIEARGEGILNARYGTSDPDGWDYSYEQKLRDKNKFQTYRFLVVRNKYSSDMLIVEKKGRTGHAEIRRVEVFAEKEIKDGKLEVTDNGTYTFVAEGNNGNLTRKSIDVTNIDREKPKVSLSKNGGGYARNHRIKVTATDDDSGIGKVEYKWTTSSKFPSSGFTTISNEDIINTPTLTGDYYLHIKATDRAGNESAYNSSPFKVDMTKPSKPTIKASSNWQNKDVEVSIIGGSDSHSGVDKTEYRTNSGSWNNYNSPFIIISNGETTIEARTKDKVGNISKVVKTTVKIDKIKPTLMITPNTTKTTHNDVVLTVKGMDNHSGVKRIKTPDDEWINKNEITYTANENGTYKFEIEDNVGNTNVKSITVDNIDKSISFEGPQINKFPDITLKENTQTIATNVSPIIVKDWRDNSNKWRISVSANRLTNGSHELPTGSVKLKGVSSITRIKGNGNLPIKELITSQVIDKGKVDLVTSSDARGEYKVSFPNNALEILINPMTAKKGTYKSIIHWELINAP